MRGLYIPIIASIKIYDACVQIAEPEIESSSMLNMILLDVPFVNDARVRFRLYTLIDDLEEGSIIVSILACLEYLTVVFTAEQNVTGLQ